MEMTQLHSRHTEEEEEEVEQNGWGGASVPPTGVTGQTDEKDV